MDCGEVYRAHRDDVSASFAVVLVIVRLSTMYARPFGPRWHEACRHFRGDAPLRAWILGIARHKTLDAWQRNGACSTLDSQLGDGGPLAALLGIHPPTTPSRALARRRRAAALHAAFEKLRPEDRELLELRFMLDLKPAEIAHVLETPVSANAIAQRIVRATQRLRHELIELGLTA